MKKIKLILVTATSVLLIAAICTVETFAAPPKASLAGTWNLTYADGSEGTMTVDKNNFTLKIPVVGEIKGMIQTSGEYFESILSERKGGINFIFGYIKGDKLEGKLQEQSPCSELKKAFTSGIAAPGANSCQMPFKAVRK